jgi:NNMT/PNMT/TEMT family protein
VISAYCADSATADRAVWELLMRNIGGLVRPGGLFITAALRRARFYTVGGKRFPSANVDEHDLRAALAPYDAVLETHALHAENGYEGIVLAAARRIPDRANADAQSVGSSTAASSGRLATRPSPEERPRRRRMIQGVK